MGPSRFRRSSTGTPAHAAPRPARTSRRRWTLGALGLGTVAAVSAGVAVGPVASAQASYHGDFSMDQLDDLLNNDMVLGYIEACRNADGSTPVPAEGERPVAVADCSQATGDGLAIVLPDKIELGTAAENTTVNLGDDITIPLVGTITLGDRNLFEILSAAALGSGTVKDIAAGLGLPRIDPTQLGKYSSYAQVQADAALPVEMVTERYCDGVVIFGKCVGSWKERTYDRNATKRADAVAVAEYLTGHSYDASAPVELPDMDASGPRGTATVAGDGISVAAAMRDGNATAEAKRLFELPSLALAGADRGRSSVAHSTLGIGTALNMDSDEIGLTWFGQALNLDRLRELGIEKYAGDEVTGLLDTVENLDLPALKEVSCFGVNTSATAGGLGSCTNILGTFDRYEDLRDPVAGESRQTQWGLTDLSSLVLGNDALVRQLTGDAESTPFLDSLVDNLTGEEGRLKFAKDFVRFTRDVATEETEVPVLDGDGNPVLDDAGDPVTEKGTRQTTAAWLTSDYGLREPVTVEWGGHRVVFFPAVELNGTQRPNLIGLPEIERITDGADTGLMPKISLVTWDHAFGLGTVTLDDLTRPDRVFTNWATSVTLPGDLKWIGDLLDLGTTADTPAEDAGAGAGEDADGADCNGAPETTGAPSESADPVTPGAGDKDGTDGKDGGPGTAGSPEATRPSGNSATASAPATPATGVSGGPTASTGAGEPPADGSAPVATASPEEPDESPAAEPAAPAAPAESSGAGTDAPADTPAEAVTVGEAAVSPAEPTNTADSADQE